MSRAKQLAEETFPEHLFGNDRESLVFGFEKGYSQAEKDLALTVEDIKQIIRIHYDIVFKDETGVRCGDVAEEVLRRFNKAKKGKK